MAGKKVSFGEPPPSEQNEDELLVVVNDGTFETKRQRKRSRAESKVSMGSDTGEKEEIQSHVRTDSFVSIRSTVFQGIFAYLYLHFIFATLFKISRFSRFSEKRENLHAQTLSGHTYTELYVHLLYFAQVTVLLQLYIAVFY